MKLLLSIILLFSCTLMCRSQVSLEIERREKITRECNCPNQVINTDSVYSFINSNPFKPLELGYNIFIIEDKPIPINTLLNSTAKYHLFDHLRAFYEEEVPFERNEKIPPKVLQKMLAITFDSTTQFTEPIVKWNVARMGEQWINRSNYRYISDLTEKNIANNKGKKNEQAAEIFRSTINHSLIFFNFSVPVFDDDYNYAFMVCNLASDSDGNYDVAFALFKRDEQGWNPFYVIKKMRFGDAPIATDFRYYNRY